MPVCNHDEEQNEGCEMYDENEIFQPQLFVLNVAA